MSASESFVISDAAPSSDNDDVDSLASISTDDLSSEGGSDAQREWEASLEQLQLILTMVLIPFAGKYFGRKFAYWSGWPSQKLRAAISTEEAGCCSGILTSSYKHRLGAVHGMVP